jgi:hypothetical protein
MQVVEAVAVVQADQRLEALVVLEAVAMVVQAKCLALTTANLELLELPIVAAVVVVVVVMVAPVQQAVQVLLSLRFRIPVQLLSLAVLPAPCQQP